MPTRWTAALALFVMACAQTQAPKSGDLAKRQDVAKTETVAFECEREINLAEKALSELQPDRAMTHLEAATRSLEDPKIEAYPDATQLRERHRALLASVPNVREEVRKRELAAQVAQAKERVEQARARAKDAMARLVKKGAGEEDVEQADESLEIVKRAIEEARVLEDKDPGYAKYSLGAQKELAAQRTSAEQRKHEIAVDRDKAEIARTSGELADAIKRIAAKDAQDAEIERARAAADEVQKALAQAAPRAEKDPRFAAQVSQAKDKLATQRTSIDARRHQILVLRQRARVDEAKKSFTAAMDALEAKEVEEAAFQAAEAAVTVLDGALEDGAPLAAKDAGYSAYATELRKRAAGARVRIAARKVALEVARHKAQIAVARITLDAAMTKVAGKGAAEADFAAAREALAALEKALDGAESVKDRDFAKLVLDTRKLVPPMRTQLDKRKVDLEVGDQRAKLEAALATMGAALGKLASEADIKAAEVEVAAVEKLVADGDKFGGSSSDYLKLSISAMKAASAAKKQLADKGGELLLVTQREKVEAEITAARPALEAIETEQASDAAFKAAEAALARVKKVLDDGAKLEDQLPKYGIYAIGVRKSLSGSEARLAQRRVAYGVRDRRGIVETALEVAAARISAARSPEATEVEVKEAGEALRVARDELAKGSELEKSSADYASFAAASRKQIATSEDEVTIAKHSLAFREGPIAKWTAGVAALGSAKGKPAGDQRKALESALESFRACQRDAAAIIVEAPKLASAVFVMGREEAKGSAVISICAEQAKSAEAKLAGTSATATE